VCEHEGGSVRPADEYPVVDLDAFRARLGVPGLFDVHTHFHPPRVFDKIRAAFDMAGPFIGREWPILYRSSEEELLATLRSFGVRRFPALTYAHRPGMAEFLNAWCAEFAERTPGSLRSGTFYPETAAEEYVAKRLAEGVEIFKVHVQVGGFSVLDPALEAVWGLVEEARVPVVLHAGSGPMPGEHTGHAPVAELLRRHPQLTLVLAHMGAPEYAEFIGFAETYANVHLDTTMLFTDFFDQGDGAFPPGLLPRLAALQAKVLFGSDYPNIPYPYAHQVFALERLGLGDAWLRAVCWQNGVCLFGAE
jgi:predicted TIM-barrel fold metal-dependent hydrolase